MLFTKKYVNIFEEYDPTSTEIILFDWIYPKLYQKLLWRLLKPILLNLIDKYCSSIVI